MTITAQKRKKPKTPLLDLDSENLFTSVELSKIFTIIYPKIHEMDKEDFHFLNAMIESLFTGSKKTLLQLIEKITSVTLREYLEEILKLIDRKKAKIHDLKDIDVLLTAGRTEILNAASKKTLKKRCDNLHKLGKENFEDT